MRRRMEITTRFTVLLTMMLIMYNVARIGREGDLQTQHCFPARPLGPFPSQRLLCILSTTPRFLRLGGLLMTMWW